MKNKIIIGCFICALVVAIIFSLFLQGSENGGAGFESSKDKAMETSTPKDSGHQRSVKRESRSDRKILDKKNLEFTPVTALSLLEFSNFGLKKIVAIRKSLESGSGWVNYEMLGNGEPVKTPAEAFNWMHKNVNMACIPKKYIEDDEFFYFSGGATAYEVLDFSSGIAVSKKDRSVKSWEIAP
jgi:hypothetical protein